MKRAVVMAETRMIDIADLELGEAAEEAPDLDLRAARLRAEREVLRAALARSNNTMATAARLLGVSRPTLYGLMEAHGIDVEGLRPTGSPAGAPGADAAAVVGGVEIE
jgi:two-component system NtrC family response regulator